MEEQKSRASSLLKKEKKKESPTMREPVRLETSILEKMATTFFDRVKETGKFTIAVIK